MKNKNPIINTITTLTILITIITLTACTQTRIIDEPDKLTQALQESITGDVITGQQIGQWLKINSDQTVPIAGTGSMIPLLRKESKVLLRNITNTTPLHINDIIVYTHPKNQTKKIIHRIVYTYQKNNTEYYLTAGDNNKIIDPYEITREHMIGKMIGMIYINEFEE